MVPKFVLYRGGYVGVLILGWLSVCATLGDMGLEVQAVLIPFSVYIIHASFSGTLYGHPSRMGTLIEYRRRAAACVARRETFKHNSPQSERSRIWVCSSLVREVAVTAHEAETD